MDNFFELLILLVFVLSGLNSLFGKKKKQEENKNEKVLNEDGTKKVPSPNKKRQSNKELFEELFGIPSQPTSKNDPFEENFENVKNTNQEETWDPVAEFENKPKEIYTPKVSISESKKVKEIPESQYSKNETTRKNLEINKKAIELRSIIINNKSVKNSLIIAELLNKPKALRR